MEQSYPHFALFPYNIKIYIVDKSVDIIVDKFFRGNLDTIHLSRNDTIQKHYTKGVKMGCAYPIKVKNPNFESGGVQLWKRQKYYFVPCGYCLGCMKSKRSWLSDVCNFEYNYFGIGSFTTLTYDDENLPIDYENERAILNYKDCQDFFKRLRINVERKYGKDRRFSYVIVGEYGSENERSHYHILFFGLDWCTDDKIITESWNKGIVKNLPIKQGGINYVLKYMDKDRIRNNKHYNENKDLRPFLKHSIGMGNRFIESRLEEIIKNKGFYSFDNGRTLRPIPSYYLRKLRLNRPTDTVEVRRKMFEEQYLFGSGKIKDMYDYSFFDVRVYLYNKARKEVEDMIRISRDKGEPQEDYDEIYWKLRQREMF